LVLQRLLHLLDRLLQLTAGPVQFGRAALAGEALQLALQLFRFIQELLLGLRCIAARGRLTSLLALLSCRRPA
jgi:hypothetical protein